MLATVKSSAVVGLDAIPIEVEVRIRGGKNIMTIIGLADSAIQESRGRIVSCLEQSGFNCSGEVLVNLAPAEVKKEGSSFDLPIAIALLLASRQVKLNSKRDIRFVGELSLEGGIRPIRGVISHVIEALGSGAECIVVPGSCLAEAKLISGIEVVGANSLAEVVQFIREGELPPISLSNRATQLSDPPTHQLSDVSGQEIAKRALIVAAAGGHNLLLFRYGLTNRRILPIALVNVDEANWLCDGKKRPYP